MLDMLLCQMADPCSNMRLRFLGLELRFDVGCRITKGEGLIKRKAMALAATVFLVSVSCFAFTMTEFGFHINLDRLAAANAPSGRWHASIKAYMQTEIDDIWRMESGIGFDFAEYSPFASIGFLASILTETDVCADLVLQWIPRFGIAATIGTGIRYQPQLSEKSRLILETYPVMWSIISVDHRYIPIPEIDLSLTIGAVLLLDQGGFFGEAMTVEAYKIEAYRLPFSLFVGNGWFLTAGQLTTRAGYRL